MPSLNDALGIHAEAMTMRGRRAEVLATNIANADTPGYKARDVDFRVLLGQQTDAIALRQTNARHMAIGGDAFTGALLYRQPQQPSLDQNTVDVQVERAAFLDNAMRYQASLTFLNGRIAGLNSALRGE